MPTPLEQLLGFRDVGSVPYVAPQRADVNAEIDPEALKHYMAVMEQQYPHLFPVQQGAWDEMVKNWRPSLNIEDRRGKIKKGRE